MRPPLIVFDSAETAFTSNGLRLLSPVAAEHTLEMNQAGSIHVEQPLDRDGDWKSLLLGNIICAPVPFRGETRWQPFRIYRRTKKRSGSAPLVSVDALHVFYDLNCVLLEDVRPTDLTGQAAIQYLFDNPYAPVSTARYPLQNFRFYSDIDTTATAYYQWKTMTSALIGDDNCILNRWGGELFVNGYYFSICRKMEGSLQNAFHIAYGMNLTEVEETVDNTNTFCQLIGQDNHGHGTYAWITPDYSGLPFVKTLHAEFSYADDTDEADIRRQFSADFQRYFKSMQEIETHYSVRYADLAADDPFRQLASYEVGDSGTIEDSELGISTEQRIIKTVTNLLTGERISTETGNAKRSIARKQAFSNTVTTEQDATQKQIAAVGQQVDEIEFALAVPTPITTDAGKYLTTAGGKYLLYKKG